MIPGFASRLLLPLAGLALMLAGTAHAQTDLPAGAGDGAPDIHEQLSGELMRSAGEYWTPKLNDYKRKVDELLVPADLKALDRLRARWAILSEERKSRLAAMKSSQEMSGKSEATLELDPEMMERYRELMDVYVGARAIAERYRPGLEKIGSEVRGDLKTFMHELSERLARFAAENRQAVDGDPKLKELTGGTGEAIFTAFDSEKGDRDLQMIYQQAVEPVVLLYSGTELGATLAGSMLPVVRNVTATEASALKQNFPNPASSTTTIPYTLAEASTITLMRLYNASGDLVALFDIGPRPAGENALQIDVSPYPSGTYLYHLTVETSKGTRVYAKTMKVVR